ncbi:MAG TPA: hypothetical protein VFB06_28420 [Streptosporangiaceae bacterium]|nr:hypothetical protein [Streptosporangiaceae bacterium]
MVSLPAGDQPELAAPQRIEYTPRSTAVDETAALQVPLVAAEAGVATATAPAVRLGISAAANSR